MTADPQVVAEALRADADLAGYIRDARSTEDPCEHWVGQALAVCAPCLRDRIAPHFAEAVVTALAPADTPGAVGADERAAAVAAVHAMEAVTVEPSVEQYVDAVLATRTSGADERAALGEVIDRLAALKSPLREPANEAAWEQGVKAAIREVRILTARASGAGETGLRGLRFRVGTACDGYAALMESDAPDGEDVESYILGAADAANAIRAALADTAGQAGGETDG